MGPRIRHPLPASINRCYHTKLFFLFAFVYVRTQGNTAAVIDGSKRDHLDYEVVGCGEYNFAPGESTGQEPASWCADISCRLTSVYKVVSQTRLSKLCLDPPEFRPQEGVKCNVKRFIRVNVRNM